MTRSRPTASPVEEPTPVDDVVGRADEGLADAEAAGAMPSSRARARRSSPQSPSPSCDTSPLVGEDAAAMSSRRRRRPVRRARRRHAEFTDCRRLPGRVRLADDAETVVVAPVVTPSEPVVDDRGRARRRRRARRPAADLRAGARGAAPRGNRAAAGAIGLARRAVVRRPVPRRVARLRRASRATSPSTTSARSRSPPSARGRCG